jgi:nucleolar protein 56
MNAVAPNLAALIGDIVGSKLISHAGGLTNLSKYPASTIQILGAEKALFRALKTKGKTPKYGLIFNSSFIGRANQKNKGRISRYLANKCAIASRVDCFSEHPTAKFGEVLKDQMEERLNFLSKGTKPRKNKDVMNEVIAELKTEGLFYGDKVNAAKGDDSDADEPVKEKKRDKKEKSKKKAESSDDESVVVEKKKSKKDKKEKKDKKRKAASSDDDSEVAEAKPEKKKKKSKD